MSLFTETPTSDASSSTAASYVNFTSSTYKPVFGGTEIAITASIMFPLFIFGIIGNVLTIVVIYRSPKLKSTFHYIILSICLSDLISAILSPLYVYQRTWGFLSWDIPNFLCGIFWGGDNFTSVATSFHILLFAFFRFISLMYPHRFKRITSKHVKIILLVVWMISVGVGVVPFVIMFGVREIDRRFYIPARSWPSCTVYEERVPMMLMYSKIGYSLFFYIPMILITVLSLKIAWFIYSRKRQRREAMKKKPQNENSNELKQQNKEKGAILQLFLIVGSFALGYIPHTAYHIYVNTILPWTNSEVYFQWWLGQIEYITLRVSECLNPVFYNLASPKIRKETKTTIKQICGDPLSAASS
ncbi:growth hormone secretagogue receptor type 1-like [Clavelina lepadiformis]|uniref:growth hormone secretagogue receptor type 1-like n=1 Tax=Clavelina lepadiformis TaxID=159417 RepID=UPI0040410E81